MVHFELGFEVRPGTGQAHLTKPVEEFKAGTLGESAGV